MRGASQSCAWSSIELVRRRVGAGRGAGIGGGALVSTSCSGDATVHIRTSSTSCFSATVRATWWTRRSDAAHSRGIWLASARAPIALIVQRIEEDIESWELAVCGRDDAVCGRDLAVVGRDAVVVGRDAVDGRHAFCSRASASPNAGAEDDDPRCRGREEGAQALWPEAVIARGGGGGGGARCRSSGDGGGG